MKSKDGFRKGVNENENINPTVRIVLIAVMVIAIGILIGAVSYTLNKMHQYRETADKLISYSIFNTTVEVTKNSVGLNADTDGLKYGKTTPGNGGTRFLDINTTQDAFVEIFLSGDMSAFLSVDENSFYMSAGESRRVPVYLDVPDDAVIGFYTGRIYILMTIPEVVEQD